MSKIMSAKQAGEKMHLPHKEVIRRIRRKDIKATKIGGNGWNWLTTEEWVEEAMQSDWYKRLHTNVE